MIVIFDISYSYFIPQVITENPGVNGLTRTQRGIELKRNLSTPASSSKDGYVGPGLSQILSKVFLSWNMQLKLTKYCWTFTLRYSNDNTKYYSKQYIGRQNTKTEQNFNPGSALIGLSGSRTWVLEQQQQQ